MRWLSVLHLTLLSPEIDLIISLAQLADWLILDRNLADNGRIVDNSYPRHIVPKTTRTQGDS